MELCETKVREVTVRAIAEILEIDATSIRGGDRLREDLGMDSLGSLELLSYVSSELQLDLEPEDAMDIATVDDACAFIERAALDSRGSHAHQN
jgi:acyl carrier protein